ncbi:hypothetical protein ES703_77291 [subsurface metagenome]
MRKAVIFIVLAFLLGLCAPVYAIPALPHFFYGSVEINGSPAPDGTLVSATVGDVSQNPVETAGGSYGINSPMLLVQGDGLSGTITFYVKGVEAEGQTAPFEPGGGPTRRDLLVTIAAPEPDEDGGVGGGGAMYVETNLFGTETSFRIDETGKVLKSIEATSKDGNLTLTIPKGTIALNTKGKRLKTLEAAIDETPPKPPVNAHIIVAYDFGPAGATFDPPITLTYVYDPDALPVDEEDLEFAYYEVDGKWVKLDFVVDTEKNTITASISHFTTFAVLGMPPAAFTSSSLAISPAEVAPGEKVNISISVANTGGREGRYTVALKLNGVKEAEERVTVAAGSSQDVSFSVTKEEAGSYSVTVDGLSGSFTVVALPVPTLTPTLTPTITPTLTPTPVTPTAVPPPPPPGINWVLWGAVIAGVVVVAGLLIFRWVRRRAD